MAEISWDLVGDAVKTGKYNLLLGAGVSLDSISGDKERTCPGAGALRDELQDALPKVRAGSSLNRLYKTMTEDQITDLITRRFLNCMPGETVKAIASFRWRRIFTLNIDDALERAYELSLVPTQKVKSINYNDPYAEVRDLRILPIIHLHGFSRRAEDGYVFDIKEYMRSISNNNIWAHVLGSIIRTEPFIVLGSSLEEPDLSYFIADRAHLTPRVDRASSILVEPFPDDGTLVDCEEFAMQLYNGTSRDFLNEADTRFPARPSVNDAIEENLGDASKLDLPPAVLAEFHSDFERVPNEMLSGVDGGTNFAYGHQATWLDIQSGRDVSRVETTEFQSRVIKARPEVTHLIDGLAGSGKSTFLRRVAWNLSQAGHQCFWLRSIGRIRIESAQKILEQLTGRTYVFIDNFADNVNEVAVLSKNLKSRPIIFIGAERTYRHGHILRVYGGEPLDTYRLGPIGANLAERLTQAYTTYGLASPISPKVDQVPLTGETIAVACCRILNNFEPLDAIIDRSIRDAKSLDLDCYIFAALSAHCYRLGIEYDLISRQFRDYHVDIQADDDTIPLPIKIENFSGVDFVTPLNDAVADAILKKYSNQDQDGAVDTFLSLATAIRPRVNLQSIIDGEPSARLASRLFDYDEVVKPLLGIEGAERFYDGAREEWNWNSRYWHQIAQFRLDMASLSGDPLVRREMAEQAVQHVRFAKTIEPHHQFTMTTIGKTLFGKIEVLSKVSPSDLDEAIKALKKAIDIEKRRGRVTVHPFMILFNGLIDSLNLGATLSFEQRGAALDALSRAREEFPRDQDLTGRGAKLRAML